MYHKQGVEPVSVATGRKEPMGAEYLFNQISTGHKRALPRPSNSATDRMLRRMVEDANMHGDCIINVGHGYYRPDPADDVDAFELNQYCAKELKRARTIQLKRLSMRQTFERWREDGVFVKNSGQTGQSK